MDQFDCYSVKLGGIYVGREALSTPAEMALELNRVCNMPSRASTIGSVFSTTNDWGQKKSRPCLVNASYIGDPLPMIYAMGTFGGAPKSKLAEVYQHFVIPVFPNLGAKSVDAGSEEIVRTEVPWDNDTQWIMGYAYVATEPMKGYWWDAEHKPSTVSAQTLREIEMLSVHRSRDWKLKMTGVPGFAKRARDNYYESLREMKRETRRRRSSRLQSLAMFDSIAEIPEPTDGTNTRPSKYRYGKLDPSLVSSPRQSHDSSKPALATDSLLPGDAPHIISLSGGSGSDSDVSSSDGDSSSNPWKKVVGPKRRSSISSTKTTTSQHNRVIQPISALPYV